MVAVGAYALAQTVVPYPRFDRHVDITYRGQSAHHKRESDILAIQVGINILVQSRVHEAGVSEQVLRSDKHTLCQDNGKGWPFGICHSIYSSAISRVIAMKSWEVTDDGVLSILPHLVLQEGQEITMRTRFIMIVLKLQLPGKRIPNPAQKQQYRRPECKQPTFPGPQ